MTTLSLLKSTIADDLARPDLTSQIAAAISQAIAFYKGERLFINETRDSTFATVAGQSRYSSADDADIPLFLTVDGMFLEDAGNTYEMSPDDPVAMEFSLGNGPASGRPYSYAYFNQSFTLYPIPDAAYTVRPLGQIKIAEPASDSEPGNVWMTKGYELIRCTAKAYIFLHTVKDPDQAAVMAIGAEREIARLRRETGKRTATGMIRATQW